MTDAGKPTKRRAGATRRGLMEAAAPAPRHELPTTAAPSAAAPVRRLDSTGGRLIKYSLTLDEDTSEVFDDLVKKARRKLGRHVDKAMIVRAVIT